MTALFGLQIYGPLDLNSLAAKLGRPADSVDWELWELEGMGLAVFPPSITGPWSATEAGRRMVDHHEAAEVSAVRRDEARECVGVSHE